MFSKSILASVFLAASALAVPFSCSTAKALMELPTSDNKLTKQAGPPSFALLGVGVQNYTCAADGKYVAAGAVAELFDISCLAGKPAFKTVQDTAYTIFKLIPDKFLSSGSISKITSPLQILSSGKHYFTTTAAGGIAPVWDMRSTGPRAVQGKTSAYVVGQKVNDIPAPTGAKDVAWLEIKGIEGKLATLVYRTDTRGGPPPASCKVGSAPISVKYTSKYFLFGSTVA